MTRAGRARAARGCIDRRLSYLLPDWPQARIAPAGPATHDAAMFDRIFALLRDIPGIQVAPAALADDPRVAAIALLYHVMDADGVRERAEVEQLRPLASEMFGLEGAELDRVLAAGERADDEAIDLYAFTSVINRHLDHKAKLELIAIMWELVFADGELHELEDNVVWRVAELLHIERDDRIALRLRVQDAHD